ncbi:MAG: hypothetical protein NC401_16825 [Ruminococcus sp.]|nr:hypothetical protein [Ruminococcus sp.]
MRHKKTAIDKIVALSEREGLTYGQYVAREYTSHTQRRRHVPDVCKPRGYSTIQAALRYDCPGLCSSFVPKPIPELIPRAIPQKPKEPRSDEQVHSGVKGRRSLPPEKVVKIHALRAQGLSYKGIAAECGVSVSSVLKYLHGK